MYEMIDFLLGLDKNKVVKDYDIEYYNNDITIITFNCEDNGEKFVKKFEMGY